jgi:hypothetical protein
MAGSADNQSITLARLGRLFREAGAIVLWSYIALRIFGWDLDRYVAPLLAADMQWLLKFKGVVLLGLAVPLFPVLGRKKFLSTVLYVLAYPLVVFFWKLPRVVWKGWPLLVAFSPVIYRAVSTFPETLLIYTVAVLSALTILFCHSKSVLLAAMTGLLIFLGVHLSRSFRNAYNIRTMAGLASFLASFRGYVLYGVFDVVASPPLGGSGVPTQSVGKQMDPSSLYLWRCLTDIVIEKVSLATKTRRHDLYLVLSWLYTVALTTIVFSLSFLALQKAIPVSFGIVTERGSSFWAFLGYSLGNLTPVRVSMIAPVSRLAVLLTYAEGVSAVLIFVILVFAVLTAARESYKAGIEECSIELRSIAAALDQRATSLYKLTMAELELFLLQDQSNLVSFLRKARGLPELQAQPIPARMESGTPQTRTGSVAPNTAA